FHVLQQRMGCTGVRHRCSERHQQRHRPGGRGAGSLERTLPVMQFVSTCCTRPNHMKALRLLHLLLALSALVLPGSAWADDIDIFLGTSGGTAGSPNIIFLIDNSPNWSRAAQQWPDNGGNQGQAELAALSSTLNRINSTRPANVGLAMLTAYAGTNASGATPGTGGAYIRFGVRDMTNATNRVALQNILAGISANITDPAEKVAGMAEKDEDAGFYEIYKYLSGLAPYTGLYGSSYANQNVFVDVPG